MMLIGTSAAVVITGTVVYTNARANLQEEVGISTVGQLRQAGIVIEMILAEIDRTAGHFVINEDITDYAMNPSLPDSVPLNQIASNMAIINEVNKVIHSIYIYFEEPSRVISSIFSEIYYLNQFYDLSWVEAYEDIRNAALIPTHEVVRNIGETRVEANVITWMRKLPLAGEKKGAIIMNIDESILSEMITDRTVRSSEQFLVLDAEGNVLISSDKSQLYHNLKNDALYEHIFKVQEGYFSWDRKDHKQMLVSFTSTGKHQWKVISFIPTQAVYDNIQEVQHRIVFGCLSLLVIGILFSWLISSRVYLPIRRLVESFSTGDKRTETSRDEVAFLREMFGQIIGEKELLKQRVADSLPAIQMKLFKELITSGSLNEDDFHMYARRAELPLASSYFQVVVFEIQRRELTSRIKTDEGMSMIGIYLKEKIREGFLTQFTAFAEMVELGTVAVIINHERYPDEPELVRLMDLCSEVTERCRHQLNIHVYCGLGLPVAGHSVLYESYLSATEALNYKHLTAEKRVVYYKDISNFGHEAFDPQYDKERLLLQYIRSGEKENAILVIQRMEDSLRSQRSPMQYAYSVYTRLLGALEKEAGELGIALPIYIARPTEANGYAHFETLEEFGNALRYYSENMIEQLSERKKSKYWDTVVKAQHFIREHLQDDLAVEDIADQVGLSTSHFSRIFREETGNTFVEYLTSVRLEHAKELLEKTDLKMFEISKLSGFQNQSYFSLLFKNMYGITPKGHRDLTRWKAAADSD